MTQIRRGAGESRFILSPGYQWFTSLANLAPQAFSKFFPNISLGGSLDIKGLPMKKLGKRVFSRIPTVPLRGARTNAKPSSGLRSQ
jgi:hypothetical protein